MTSIPAPEDPSCPASAWPAGAFGQPIPADPHAVSVWMPCWQDVVDYEEGAERARRLMQCGYPRFFYHPFYLDLCRRHAAPEGAVVRVFPSLKTARECFAFAGGGTVLSDDGGVIACAFPAEMEALVKSFWQHTGAIVSSRQALDICQDTPAPEGAAAKTNIRNTLSDLYRLPAGDIYLYSNGMAAIFAAHRAVRALTPDARTIQLGFPYLDSLKIQEKFGEGCVFITYDGPADLAHVERALEREKIAAVFMEVPTNPLLNVIDLAALKSLLGRYNVPLVIDDTVGTPVDLDVAAFADIMAGSLTKFFCGSGDVTGGSLALNPSSPFFAPLKAILESGYEDLLYGADARMLDRHSGDFTQRMAIINRNAGRLADYLHAHPLIEKIWYPKFTNPAAYDALRRDKASRSYGGLMSILLKDGARNAAPFYDALPVHKGPSLGTRFTIACPYTLLAHYHELEDVERLGISRYLIRISVGAEDGDDLLRRFAYALDRTGTR